jgi:hypothetical protein
MTPPTPPPPHKQVVVFTVLGLVGLIATGVLLDRYVLNPEAGARKVGQREVEGYVGAIVLSLVFLWRAYRIRTRGSWKVR